MRRIIFLMLCLVLVAACRQESTPAAEADLTINLRVLPTDARVGEAEFLIDITDADGRAVSPERVDVRGDMDHAGMQPVLRDDLRGSNGKYRVAFEWTMAGDWTVTVRLTFADDSVLEETFDVNVAMAMEEATPTPEPEDGEGPTPIPTLRGMGGISRGGAAAETPFGAWQGTPDRTQQALTQEAEDATPTAIPTLRGMGGISRGGAAAETPFGAWQDRSGDEDSESEEEEEDG
ncbi:MAG: FixH family protein [Anaerolineaceae bacterium]|nr:FixH family protein [Anaerolineaceae bacterium]